MIFKWLIRNVLGFVRLLVTFLPSTKKIKSQHRQSRPFWGELEADHEWSQKQAQFCLLQELLLRSRDTRVHFQNTLDQGNSDPMSRTIPPVLELTASKKTPAKQGNPSIGAHAHTTKQAVTCSQCYQGKLGAGCTTPISLHALKRSSPRSTPYVLLPCCIRSTISSSCIFPSVNREPELP